MDTQSPFASPAVRRGFWLAVVLGCLALLSAIVSPVTGVLVAALFFAIAWGMRRRQVWAATTGALVLGVPSVFTAVQWRETLLQPVLLADIAIALVFLYLMATTGPRSSTSRSCWSATATIAWT